MTRKPPELSEGAKAQLRTGARHILEHWASPLVTVDGRNTAALVRALKDMLELSPDLLRTMADEAGGGDDMDVAEVADAFGIDLGPDPDPFDDDDEDLEEEPGPAG